MKKALALLLTLLLMFSFAAFAETAEPEVEAPWYELSVENTVLTVRLPVDAESGLSWSFEISNPEALELITQETTEATEEAPSTYVASFMTTANAENSISLILKCADESKPEEPAVYTRVLELSTAADNKITVISVLEQAPFGDWCEYGDDGYILTTRMPDAGWNFLISDPEVLSLITCDDSEGYYVASFMATMEKADFVEIYLYSDDQLRTRAINAFVNESGEISVKWVNTFEVLKAD